MSPKVSVIIPLYNKELYIKRAIDSVLAQTFQDFEIVVIDDGSKDGSAGVVRQMTDPRIRLIQQTNGGECAARNRAIMEAKTDLLALLDADDEWKPGFLAAVMRLREKYPEAGAYATAYEIKDTILGKLKVNYRAIPPAPWEGIIPNYFESGLGIPPVWSSAVMIPKNVFEICGNFPVGAKLGGDLDMWLRIALVYPIAFTHEIGSTYCFDAQGRVCNAEVSLLEYPFIKTAREALNSPGLSDKNKTFLKEYISKYTINAAVECICSGHVEIGREKLIGCETQLFRQQKLKWLGLSRLPLFLIKVLAFIKLRIINRFFVNISGSTMDGDFKHA
jgi:glycosyltransferase involved in cell wall biosynthesis